MTTLSPQQQFHAILTEMGETFDRKNRDYGQDSDPFANVRQSEQWGIAPWIGAMVRATDKVTRLQTYAQKGTLANEGVEDSLLDLAVYSIIALLLFREQQEGRRQDKPQSLEWADELIRKHLKRGAIVLE